MCCPAICPPPPPPSDVASVTTPQEYRNCLVLKDKKLRLRQDELGGLTPSSGILAVLLMKKLCGSVTVYGAGNTYINTSSTGKVRSTGTISLALAITLSLQGCKASAYPPLLPPRPWLVVVVVKCLVALSMPCSWCEYHGTTSVHQKQVNNLWFWKNYSNQLRAKVIW